MEFALDQNNDRVHAIDANKGNEYYCPLCRKKVVLRKGQINIDHFAHQSRCDDTWCYDISAWHSDWQQQFPKRNQEVIIEFNGEKHRADIMACGYVVEFQHSPISAEEFNERNHFYLNYGKKVIWIFDFSDEFKSGRIDCYDGWSSKNDNGGKFKWRYPKRSLQDYLPQSDKDIIVFFQFSNSKHGESDESYIERVTWAIEENGHSNFARFFTSYYPGNSTELLEWMKENRL